MSLPRLGYKETRPSRPANGSRCHDMSCLMERPTWQETEGASGQRQKEVNSASEHEGAWKRTLLS